MAHFYGTLQGSRGEASRLGTKASGLQVTAASWDGAIDVSLDYDERTGKNRYTVRERKWHGHGVDRVIAEGVVGEPDAPRTNPEE